MLMMLVTTSPTMLLTYILGSDRSDYVYIFNHLPCCGRTVYQTAIFLQ